MPVAVPVGVHGLVGSPIRTGSIWCDKTEGRPTVSYEALQVSIKGDALRRFDGRIPVKAIVVLHGESVRSVTLKDVKGSVVPVPSDFRFVTRCSHVNRSDLVAVGASRHTGWNDCVEVILNYAMSDLDLPELAPRELDDRSVAIR